MTNPSAAVAAAFLDRVPLARTLGLQIEQAEPIRAVVRLVDRAELHNHLGGPHAGAMFSLAETATGVIVLAAFGGELHRVVPLAVSAQVEFRKLAMGDLVATAELPRPPAQILAELDAGERPVFDIPVQVTRQNGDVTAEMTVRWMLRPSEPSSSESS